VATLPPGAKLVPYAGSLVDPSWIDSWQQFLSFVLAVFGVTKSLAFLQDDTSFATLYASLRQHNLFTMCPLLQMIADALNLQLVWPYWGPEYGIELRPQKITDHEEDKSRVQVAGQFGSITHNEVRVTLGFEPTDEPWGNEQTKPSAPAQPGQPGQPGQQQPGQGGPDEQGGLAAMLGAGPEERQQPAEATAARPRNPQGQGSLGNRAILEGAKP
jgi:hypothetical protein